MKIEKNIWIGVIGVVRVMIIIGMVIMVGALTVNSVQSLTDEDILWSSGDTFTLTPEDDMATQKEYTIKVTDFPAPVRGIRTINGTVPERSIARYVTLELYKDIINNPNPIDTFILGVGQSHITADKELRITVDSMPKETSQNWVYEYYNPSVTIRLQKRAVPKLDVQIRIRDTNESLIDPGDSFRTEIRIKNIGNDSAFDINYNVGVGDLKLIMKNQSLVDTISRLDKDEIRSIALILEAPISQDEKQYVLFVNLTGRDVKNVRYNWNFSKEVVARNITKSVLVNKSSRNTVYMKENANIVLSITNSGPLKMNDLSVQDFIPNKLLYLENNTYKTVRQFSLKRDALGPMESWTISYSLQPTEPGVYLLPSAIINFSISGKSYSVKTLEKGFRVFGPKIILNKSIINRGNDVVEIKIKAKNIGNGFSRVAIKDKLPESAVLLSGKTSLTTSIDADKEKIMNYTVKISDFKGIDSVIWPPANATYYLDDYEFFTSSDEKVTEEILPQETVKTVQTVVPIPTMTEPQKRVVATISRTPIEKETPGFKIYEASIILLLTIHILRNEKRQKEMKREKKMSEL